MAMTTTKSQTPSPARLMNIYLLHNRGLKRKVQWKSICNNGMREAQSNTGAIMLSTFNFRYEYFYFMRVLLG